MISKKQLTEKLGLEYFRKLDDNAKYKHFQKKVFYLDENESRAIFKVGRQAIINAFVVGLVTSALSTLILLIYSDHFISIKDYLNKSNFSILMIIAIVSLATSLAEMIFLFFDSLKKSHKITQAAHLELFPNDLDETFVAKSIVRGALELPNPQNTEVKVDVDKEKNKVESFFKNIIIKAKSSLSAIVLKMLLKKMLGKAISRASLSFASVPVVGFWNAFETRQLMNEIQTRILGPSAVTYFVENYSKIKSKISYKAQLAILRAVGCSIVTTETLHPNLEFLFTTLKEQFEINIRNSILDDLEIFHKNLKQLSEKEQRFILYVLEFSAIIDGKVTKKERELLESAFLTCDLIYDYNITKMYLNKFKKGKIQDWTNKKLSNLYMTN